MTDRFIGVPLSFLHDTLPTISNVDELYASLTVFRLLAEAGNEETPVAESAIINDRTLRSSLVNIGSNNSLDARIFDALELAVGRNTLLRFVAVQGHRESAWYFGNTPVTRAMVLAMQEHRIPAPKVVWENDTRPTVLVDPPNIFRLYEQNIGPLTPILADQLTTAASDYPATWIEDAITEAVSYNKRNWRYILRILENWRQQGRGDNS